MTAEMIPKWRPEHGDSANWGCTWDMYVRKGWWCKADVRRLGLKVVCC
ncbi:hypothetical protein V6Z11_D01G235700 [Gossypium hirsutum]